MTKLGKLLVLLNAAFSFFMMAWALTLLSNRIDWSNNKAKDDQPPGELTKRQARIEELWKAVRPAEAAWREPRIEIVALEKQRPGDRAWYGKEFAHLRTGADGTNPSRMLVLEKGVPALDTANGNRPRTVAVKDRNGQNLRSMSYYETELRSAGENLVAQVEKHEKLVKEDHSLTVKLIGGMDPLTNMVVSKGLRQRLIDERDKMQDLVKEQELTRPLLINAYVESQLILKRADALKARIDELERLTGVAIDN